MSKIQWTDITANPIHLVKPDGSHGGHWCKKISEGCAKCYSEAQNQSNYFKFASHLKYSGETPSNMVLDTKVMEALVSARSPKKVFLCSMTDLFGGWVSDEWLDTIFAYCVIAKQHIFQILTKRPDRMEAYLSDRKHEIEQCISYLYDALPDNINVDDDWVHSQIVNLTWPLSNVWLGVSVENQKAADDRIPHLINTPAAVRFLSCEPLLEELNLSKWVFDRSVSVRRIAHKLSLNLDQADSITTYPVNWVIVGGESGSGSRECHFDWMRSLVNQCQSAGVPVFVKQFGANAIDSTPYIDGVVSSHFRVTTSDRKGGDLSNFPELNVRQFPVIN